MPELNTSNQASRGGFLTERMRIVWDRGIRGKFNSRGGEPQAEGGDAEAKRATKAKAILYGFRFTDKNSSEEGGEGQPKCHTAGENRRPNKHGVRWSEEHGPERGGGKDTGPQELKGVDGESDGLRN